MGPRGAGKSSVGPFVAARLRLAFLDADAEVERTSGESVAELLAAGRFREEEARTLGRILGGPPAVVAAGGGAVLWDGFPVAAAGWTVVWLDAAPGTLAERIARDGNPRPSLTGAAPEVEIGRVRAERAPRYEAVSAFRVDTSSLSIAEVSERIARSMDVPPPPRGKK